MRGAYTAGVLETLAETGHRFDALYGTSAGGAACAWYAAGQLDAFRRSWAYARDPAIMNVRRWVTRRGPLLDMARLYYQVYPNELGFDIDKVRRSNVPVVVTASDVATARTHFLDLRKVPVLRALHATSALPFATDGAVRIGAHEYLDGGLTAPLPMWRAIMDGHRELVVVLNKFGPERRAEPLPLSWYFGRCYPRLAEAGRHHHSIINDAVRLAEAPPDGIEVTLVRPSRDHGLSRLSRDESRIGRAMDLGRADAHRVLAA